MCAYKHRAIAVPTQPTPPVADCKPAEEEGGAAECLAVQEVCSGGGEEESTGGGNKATSCTHTHHGV